MVKPILKALLLADQVYRDSYTGKVVIAGTFNQISTERFPFLFVQQPCVFVCLTGINRCAKVQLRYVDLSTHEVVIEAEPQEIEVNDPLQIVEMIFRIPHLPHKNPGMYAFEVYANDELLGMSRVTVNVHSQGKG